MRLVINGTTSEIPDSCQNLEQLLAHLNLGYPVLVEFNGTALFPRELASTPIREGDRLELMRMVAGG